MTAILKNFVTVVSTRGDVLSPTEYRTIVEAITAIINKYDFKDLTRDYKSLLAHLSNFNDPHHDADISFLEEIITRTYAIYIHMLPNPLNLFQFRTQIVPTLSFIELFRRIILNRYLYDQVKTNTGSVPTTASAYLSEDWLPGLPGTPVTLIFPASITNEIEFIRCGWNVNSSPIPVIFSATDLTVNPNFLPVVFETISDSKLWSENEFGIGYPITLNLASNDLTIELRVVGSITVVTTLLSLRNGTDVIKIIMNVNKTVSLMINDLTMTQSLTSSPDGRIKVVISRFGYASLETMHQGLSTKRTANFVFTNDVPLTNGIIGVGYEDIFYPSFGLRSLIIYQGYTDVIPPFAYSVPAGYNLLMDPDRAYLCDPDGVPLMDYDPSFFDECDVLIDYDGIYLTDDDDLYLVDTE